MDDFSKLTGAKDGNTEPLINEEASPEDAEALLDRMKDIAATIEKVSSKIKPHGTQLKSFY